MKALILAAGYGRRLYPITKDYPKPLLLIKGRAIIDYLLDKLEGIEEIDKILVVTNNKFFSRFADWKKHINCKKPIKLINDLTSTYKSRLGALGDIDLVVEKEQLKENLIVVGGDNLFDEGLDGFFSHIEENRAYCIVGIYDIKDKSKAKRYGVVSIDREKRIIDFQEKPSKPKSSLVAMCLYYFPKEKLPLLKEYLKDEDKDHDAAGCFINWLYKKEDVFTFVFKGKWYDIGGHDFYREAREVF